MTAELVDGPALGSVVVFPDGRFEYTRPSDAEVGTNPFIETSFTYRVTDGVWASEPATVYLWMLTPYATAVSSPVPAAAADLVYIGDGPAAGDVAANDTDGHTWILAGHPAAGRLDTFAAGGGFAYTPGGGDVDAGFGYTVFGAHGLTWASAGVTLAAVNIQLYNGQNGTEFVRPQGDNEKKVGAFTVANMNDTDGNTVKDNVQQYPVRGDGIAYGKQVPGIDEIDLMQLLVPEPTAFGATDKLTVTATGGSAKFYKFSDKRMPLLNPLVLTANSFIVNGEHIGPLTFWVEIGDKSTAVRDVTIDAKVTAGNGQVSGPDTVLATGMWVELTPNGMRRDGPISPGPDAKDIAYTALVRQQQDRTNAIFGSTSGMRVAPTKNNVTSVMLGNAVEFEFQVQPAEIGKEPGIVFDVTRTVEARSYLYTTGNGQPAPALTERTAQLRPRLLDRANDDGLGITATSDSNTPVNNHIYSIDAPGFVRTYVGENVVANTVTVDGVTYLETRDVRRFNAWEFVRVDVNSKGHRQSFPLNTAELRTRAEPATASSELAATGIANGLSVYGSRASELYDWYAHIDFTWDGPTSSWVRTPDPGGKQHLNELERGTTSLRPPWEL